MLSDILEQLESNDKQVLEGVKQRIREQFTKVGLGMWYKTLNQISIVVSEPWLVNGFYEYYLLTNSIRSMEILVTVKEPHYTYLFDRLCESIKVSRMEVRVQALTLLGHVARSQTTWLYKLPEHILFKELLRLLKSESELLPLISALLVLIVLLPILPSAMGGYLNEIFDIFSRLASMNYSQSKTVEDQMIHMQVALYALFLRLYGMYPCNFLTYLRTLYKDSRNPIFVHTIKPMLDTVRMHPSLVTSSKESEKKTERWRRMGVHDVIVECERFSLDMTDRCPHDTCQYMPGFRSRSGTTNSTIESPYQMQSFKSITSLPIQNIESGFFSPTVMFQSTSATESPNILHLQTFAKLEDSPPEAAIEATPETTPVRDFRTTPVRVQTHNTNVVRALTSFNRNNPHSSLTATPTHSQPSSPMRSKERSPFTFPAIDGAVVSSRTVSGGASAFIRPNSEAVTSQKVVRMIQERMQAMDLSASENLSKSKPPPSSPLRIINPEMRTMTSHQIRNESPVSQEDEEVLSIVSRNENVEQPSRPCDSILPEFEDASNNDDDTEHGSPCTAGGLHMPNSKSMNNFARSLRRLRHHSQCNPEPERIDTSTGSSPGNGKHFASNTIVRRANSCPEIEKSQLAPLKDNRNKPFYETDEETVSEEQTECVSNTSNGIETDSPEKISVVKRNKMKSIPTYTTHTQTENFWPMPYEHLFLGIFPSLETNEIRPSPIPSPAPLNLVPEKYQPSVYDILDKFVESAINSSEGTHVQLLKNQLELLHQQLLFERHRRETHAYRNRRLLSDAKSTRLLEECNSALRDRVQLQEKDILDLKEQMNMFRRERLDEEEKLYNTIQYWESQCMAFQRDCVVMKEKNEILERELNEMKRKCIEYDLEKQQDKACLIDMIAECNVAKEQAHAGEQGKHELERVNKELLLIGELHMKYKEKLEALSTINQSEEQLTLVREAYKDELKGLHRQIETKSVFLDACRVRILELERTVASKEESISEHKRILSEVKEQHQEVLEAVESKYQNQLTLNRILEERFMELHQRWELESGKRNVNSPHTSSCHEVEVTTTAGMSPHSSPLSASLASSEGSGGLHGEVKNIQAILESSDEHVDADDGQQPTTSTYRSSFV